MVELRRNLVRARAWLHCRKKKQLLDAGRLPQSCSMLLTELTTRRWLTRKAAGGRMLLLPTICNHACEHTCMSGQQP